MGKSRDLARIIGECTAGDAESLDQLVDMYAQRCYGYFYRLTGSKELSDDLLGELFVKVVGKIRSFKKQAVVRGLTAPTPTRQPHTTDRTIALQ